MNFESTSHPTMRYQEIRARTSHLVSTLSEEDCGAQSFPDASPVKWHLAHTTWFFETFILERFEPDFIPFNPSFRFLFNSYYDSVGSKFPRPHRGLLTRPDLKTVFAYREDVDRRILKLVQKGLSFDLESLLELGLQHEQQHQELILTDVKHLFSSNPLKPAYSDQVSEIGSSLQKRPMQWVTFDGGLVEIGHSTSKFAFDNERPQHRQFLEPYRMANRLVTNGEYQAFVESGGYEDPRLWLSEGWEWIRKNRIQQPLYWSFDSEGWKEFTLSGEKPLSKDSAIRHVSYFEADAYARWFGARLPTEAEWENAARIELVKARTERAIESLFSVAWQWTSSSYSPYPGFRVLPGAVGEYNGKFMVNQYVLRGSSLATPPGHERLSYRNFFPTATQWQFTGIRLAQSMSLSQ